MTDMILDTHVTEIDSRLTAYRRSLLQLRLVVKGWFLSGGFAKHYRSVSLHLKEVHWQFSSAVTSGEFKVIVIDDSIGFFMVCINKRSLTEDLTLIFNDGL